jgi:hypothetical protein
VLNQISHILKAIGLLLLGAVGFFILRSFIVPASFGVHNSYTYGYYRGASDGELAAQPAIYQGSEACLSCHAKAAANWKEGKHAGVPCESCHGTCRAGRNEEGQKPLSDSSVAACMKCHAALRGRPVGIHQVAALDPHVQEKVKWGCQVGALVAVDNTKNVKEKGDIFAQGLRCVLCHDVHHPLLRLKDFAVQKAERERMQRQATDNESRSNGEKP